MDLTEAFAIVLDLAGQGALDPELHDDMSEEVERQQKAFEIVEGFLEGHGLAS